MTNELRQQIVRVVEKEHPMPYHMEGSFSEEDMEFFEDNGVDVRVERTKGSTQEVLLSLQ